MPFTLSHQSPVKKRSYISGDIEGRPNDLKKFTDYSRQLDPTLQGRVDFYNLGDWTDHGDSPLVVTQALTGVRKIPGNRDLNYMRFLYELDVEYIEWQYNTFATMELNKGQEPYKSFYNNQGKLKTGADFLIAAEAADSLRFNKHGNTLPLAWIDPNKPDFRTWVDRKLVQIKSACSLKTLGSLGQEVLYLQYMNEHMRGAPNAFMNWAIDLATQSSNDDIKGFKQTALALHKALTGSKTDDEYRKNYLALRAHLNKGFKLNHASIDIDNYENSFEKKVLEFFKKPDDIINLFRTSEIAFTIGTGNNKVLLIHGGIADPKDLSLPDGKGAADNINDFEQRFVELRKEFIQLYDMENRSAEQQKRYIHLARGFALMSLARGAVKDAQFHDFPELNGATASVDNTAAVSKSVQPIFEGFVGQINGHSPSRGLFATKLPFDDKFKIGIDTTYNNFGPEVTVGAVYEHDDGAQTIAVHLIDKAGVEHSIEIGTFDMNGARIWPTDRNQIIEQTLLGAELALTNDDFAKDALVDGKKDLDEMEKLNLEDRAKALESFKKGWKVQYRQDGKILLHKGGAFKKEDGSLLFFNSTAALDWETVANRTQKMTEIERTLFSAGRRKSIDKGDLITTFQQEIGLDDPNNPDKTIDTFLKLEHLIRQYKANINQHQGYVAVNKFRANYVTTTWRRCLDPVLLKAQDLVSSSARAAVAPAVLVSQIQKFNGVVTAAFGEKNLEYWQETTLPHALSGAFQIKFMNTAILTGGQNPLEQAELIFKTIAEYEPCLENDEIKENFRTKCFKIIRAQLLLELDLQQPKPNANDADKEYGELMVYIEKLESIKKHPLIKTHCNHHWWEGAYGKTATQAKIYKKIEEAQDRLLELPAPQPILTKS